MKKLILCFMTLMMTNLYADNFSSIIQDLAVQIACTGQYNATMTGGTWQDDPIDFYNPILMADRFTTLSGRRTEYQTFYGICYNYAKYAFLEIQNNQYLYEQNGMRKNQFYITGVDNVTDELSLLTLAKPGEHDTYRNGEYLNEYTTEFISSHKTTKGTRVTHHAWLWIQRDDGTWFWIDPTFTDNLGYVVYGYVDRDTDEEIQLKPDKNLCLLYPSYLNDLPEYESVRYNEDFYRIDNTNDDYDYYYELNKKNNFEDEPFIGIGYIKAIDSELNFTQRNFVDGFEIFSVSQIKESVSEIFTGAYFAYMSCGIDWNKNTSWVLGTTVGFSIAGIVAPYAGVGFGCKTVGDVNGFEHKVDLGLLINFKYFVIGGEISYGTILGSSYSIFFSVRTSKVCDFCY